MLWSVMYNGAMNITANQRHNSINGEVDGHWLWSSNWTPPWLFIKYLYSYTYNNIKYLNTVYINLVLKNG